MLYEKTRGSLELIIDQVVTSLPRELYSLQRGEAAALQVKNESDYALSFAHGAIRAELSFCLYHVKRKAS